MDRKKFFNVLNWVLGLSLCSFGVCLCTKSGFGLSMIAAPPYVLHVSISRFLPWYSQGTSEYVWQSFLLILMCLAIQRFRPRYLLSFLTAIISGVLIDSWFMLMGGNGLYATLAGRVVSFAIGCPLISLAIAFVFRTTLPIQIYELLVKEISDKFGWDLTKVKFFNDIGMLTLSIVFALALTGRFTGMGIGTIIATVFNAPMIRVFGKFVDWLEK